MITDDADAPNCREGKRAPELGAISSSTDSINPLHMHPELAAAILYDPTEPASEEDWPEEFR